MHYGQSHSKSHQNCQFSLSHISLHYGCPLLFVMLVYYARIVYLASQISFPPLVCHHKCVSMSVTALVSLATFVCLVSYTTDVSLVSHISLSPLVCHTTSVSLVGYTTIISRICGVNGQRAMGGKVG